MRSLVALVVISACGGRASNAPTIDAADDAMIAPDSSITWCTPAAGQSVAMRKVGSITGLGAILVTSPPDDERLFVIERSGQIRIFDHEQLLPDPFLDISYPKGKVRAGGSEFGLLGLAFDPNYATNGTFYVFYTTTNPDDTKVNIYLDVLSRFTVKSGDPVHADPASEEVILAIPDYASNHNAGMIEFGDDGYLYVSTGDGGGGFDPNRNGQSTTALLAKILRLDVDHPASGKPYGIPADNPFVSGGGAPEVFVYGLRNPWRWSFDAATGDMWIGDVGQTAQEELDFLPAGHQAGKNLGWSMYEASDCVGNYTCDPTDKVFPVDARDHVTTAWRAIIGGQVYRGQCYPDLVGQYFYTDYLAGGLSRATRDATGNVTITDLAGTFPSNASSLHAAARGEMYLTTTDGDVYHLEAAP